MMLGGTGTTGPIVMAGGRVNPGDPVASKGTLSGTSADFSNNGNLTLQISGSSTGGIPGRPAAWRRAGGAGVVEVAVVPAEACLRGWPPPSAQPDTSAAASRPATAAVRARTITAAPA